jgi:hypothetical protein
MVVLPSGFSAEVGGGAKWSHRPPVLLLDRLDGCGDQ